MKLIVRRSELCSALEMLVEVTERRSSIPSLMCVQLEAIRGAGLCLTATNLDQTLLCDVEAVIECAGKIIVRCRRLLAIAQAFVDSDVQIEKTDKGLTLKQGSVEYEIPLWGADFPESPKFGAVPIKVKSADMRALIGHTEFAITQEDGRYTLSGAKVFTNPSGLTMVTTDGCRMTLGIIEAKSKKNIEALIPRGALAFTVKLSRFADDILIGFSAEHFFLKAASFRLISRLFVGQFPSYEAVYPRAPVRTVTVDSKVLSAAISRVAIMADDRSHAIKIDFNGDTAVITAENAEEGKAKDSVAIAGAGEPMLLAFNGHYLQDFLSRIDGDITLELTDPETQVRMRAVGDVGLKDYFHILMPMKV